MKVLSSRKPKKSSDEFFVLDVETYTLKATKSNLWFGCIYSQNYKAYFKTHEEFFKLLDTGKFTNRIIYAHNGGRFDWLVLFGNLLAGEVIYCGARFISYKYNNICFADSLNVLKDTVKNIGEMVGYPKLELERIGHIPKGQIPSEKDIEYCYRDCEIVYEALSFVFGDGKPKLTIGALALDIFKRKYLDNKITFNEELENYYIPAYYGGRTEAFRVGKVDDFVYDINSMYPRIMATTNFPHPSFSKIIFNPIITQAIKLIYGKEGCINCVVYVPDTIRYCPLPVIHNDKLLFSVGILKGSWCFNEMRLALSMGCKIKSVNNIVTSSRLLRGKDIFGDFVDTHYKLKNEAPTNLERWHNKYILNNLYGKFGQHRLSETKYFTSVQDCAKFISQQHDSHAWNIKTYNKNRKDCYAEKEVEVFTSHSIISIAAYITAASRILLHKYITTYEPDYCDTDSLFIPKSAKLHPPQSDKMGELKKEVYTVSLIRGCKDYIKHKPANIKDLGQGPLEAMAKSQGIKNNIVNGMETIEMIKGISKSARKLSEDTFETTVLAGPRTALRRGMEVGDTYTITKRLKRVYTKGNIIDNVVYPLKLNMTK